MRHLKAILLFCCSMLFLGMIVSDTSALLLEYQNLETKGFIEQDAYYIESYDTEKVYSSYEELINLAKQKSDSFILIVKLSNGTNGVYTYNYDWNLPLKDGRVFTEEEVNSYDHVIIDQTSADRIGTSFNQKYVNLLSLPLTFSEEFSNVTTISSIPLTDKLNINTRTLIDPLFEEKRICFSCIYYVMIILIFIIHYQMNKSELVIRKLLGHSIQKVFVANFSKLFTFFFLSFLIAFIFYFLAVPQMFLYSYTKDKIIQIILLRFVIVEAMCLMGTFIVAGCYHFLPVKRLEELNVYDD